MRAIGRTIDDCVEKSNILSIDLNKESLNEVFRFVSGNPERLNNVFNVLFAYYRILNYNTDNLYKLIQNHNVRVSDEPESNNLTELETSLRFLKNIPEDLFLQLLEEYQDRVLVETSGNLTSKIKNYFSLIPNVELKNYKYVLNETKPLLEIKEVLSNLKKFYNENRKYKGNLTVNNAPKFLAAFFDAVGYEGAYHYLSLSLMDDKEGNTVHTFALGLNSIPKNEVVFFNDEEFHRDLVLYLNRSGKSNFGTSGEKSFYTQATQEVEQHFLNYFGKNIDRLRKEEDDAKIGVSGVTTYPLSSLNADEDFKFKLAVKFFNDEYIKKVYPTLLSPIPFDGFEKNKEDLIALVDAIYGYVPNQKTNYKFNIDAINKNNTGRLLQLYREIERYTTNKERYRDGAGTTYEMYKPESQLDKLLYKLELPTTNIVNAKINGKYKTISKLDYKERVKLSIDAFFRFGSGINKFDSVYTVISRGFAKVVSRNLDLQRWYNTTLEGNNLVVEADITEIKNKLYTYVFKPQKDSIISALNTVIEYKSERNENEKIKLSKKLVRGVHYLESKSELDEDYFPPMSFFYQFIGLNELLPDVPPTIDGLTQLRNAIDILGLREEDIKNILYAEVEELMVELKDKHLDLFKEKDKEGDIIDRRSNALKFKIKQAIKKYTEDGTRLNSRVIFKGENPDIVMYAAGTLISNFLNQTKLEGNLSGYIPSKLPDKDKTPSLSKFKKLNDSNIESILIAANLNKSKRAIPLTTPLVYSVSIIGKPTVKTLVVDDIIVNGLNTTDGQSITMPKFKVQLLYGSGKISKVEYDEFMSKYEKDKSTPTSNLADNYGNQSLKTLYSYINSSGVAEQIKHSEFIVNPNEFLDSPLGELYKFALENDIDVISFASTAKLLPGEVVSLEFNNRTAQLIPEDAINSIVELNSEGYGLNINEKIDQDEVIEGAQVGAMLTSFLDSIPEDERNTYINELFNLRKELDELNYADADRLIRNEKRFPKYLVGALKRDLNFTSKFIISNAINKNKPVPFYALNLRDKVDYIVTSYLKEQQIINRMSGQLNVQVSEMFVPKTIAPEGLGYNLVDEKGFYSEGVVAWNFRDSNGNLIDKSKFVNPNGTWRTDVAIPEDFKEMIVYRIPTASKNMAERVKIIGFFEGNHSAIALPTALVNRMGAHFNYDKLYSFKKLFNPSVTEEITEGAEGIQNKMIDSYSKILSSKYLEQDRKQVINYGDFLTYAKRLQSNLLYINNLNELNKINDIDASKNAADLIGMTSNYIRLISHISNNNLQYLDKFLDKKWKIVINGKEIKNKFTKGNSMVNYFNPIHFSQLQQIALDEVKLQIQPILGLNSKNLDILGGGLLIGLESEGSNSVIDTLDFITHPITKEVLNLKTSLFTQFAPPKNEINIDLDYISKDGKESYDIFVNFTNNIKDSGKEYIYIQKKVNEAAKKYISEVGTDNLTNDQKWKLKDRAFRATVDAYIDLAYPELKGKEAKDRELTKYEVFKVFNLVDNIKNFSNVFGSIIPAIIADAKIEQNILKSQLSNVDLEIEKRNNLLGKSSNYIKC